MATKKIDQPQDETQTEAQDQSQRESKEKAHRQPFVTQVVEVVGDGTEASTPTEKTPEESSAQRGIDEKPKEKPAMKLAPDMRAVGAESSTGQEENVPKDPDTLPEAVIPQPVQIQDKEVINELFQKDARVGYPEISEHKKGPKTRMVLWAVVVVVVVVAIGAGLLFFTQGSVTVTNMPVVPTTTQGMEPTGTPTQGTDLAKSDLTIQVLNGGGVRGAAGKMKSVLEGKGYTVKDTGNTDQYSYEETEISVKAGKEGYLALLAEDLKDEYKIGKKEATLSGDIPYDARVIVGKE